MPVTAKPLFRNWNFSDFGEYNSLSDTCDTTTAKQCGLGDMCAQKTSKFKNIDLLGITSKQQSFSDHFFRSSILVGTQKESFCMCSDF